MMLTVDEAANTAMRYWAPAAHSANVTTRTISIEGRRLETINLQNEIPPMNVGLAWYTNREFSPPMRAFRSYFQSAYGLPSTKI